MSIEICQECGRYGGHKPGCPVLEKMKSRQELDQLREQVKLLRDALEYYAQGGENEWVAVNALAATEQKP